MMTMVNRIKLYNEKNYEYPVKLIEVKIAINIDCANYGLNDISKHLWRLNAMVSLWLFLDKLGKLAYLNKKIL